MASSPQYNNSSAFASYDHFNSSQQDINGTPVSWGDKFTEGPERAALSPSQNMLNSQAHMMQTMDTDMSTDSHVGDPRTVSVSTHGTPSGSLNSSHTSYSPPQQYVSAKSEDPSIPLPLNIQQGGSVATYLNAAAPFGAFSAQHPTRSPLPQHHQHHQRQHHYQQQQQQRSLHHQQHNLSHPSHSPMPQQQQAQPGEAFSMAPAWGMGADVQGVESMSPLGEGNWTQMLAGIGWDTGLATGGDIPWRGGRDG